MFGLDYLGGAAYTKKVVAFHPKGWAAGFFGNTFGNAWVTVRRLARTGKCPRIRVHAVWDDNHLYNPEKHDKVIKNQFKRCLAAAALFPKVHFEFSPFCEHNIKKQALTKIFNYLKKMMPASTTNVSFVNCALNGDFIYDDASIKNETHNIGKIPAKGAYNFSYDGVDCYNADVETDKKKHAGADIFFFWTVSFNLKRNEKERLTVAKRLERNFRPTEDNIKACIILGEKKASADTPKTWIVKPMSEDCGDAKSCKLLVMMPNDAEQVALKTGNTTVAKLARFKPDVEGKARYYAKDAGYKYGNRKLEVWVKGTRLKWTINPAFRGGSYR